MFLPVAEDHPRDKPELVPHNRWRTLQRMVHHPRTPGSPAEDSLMLRYLPACLGHSSKTLVAYVAQSELLRPATVRAVLQAAVTKTLRFVEKPG